MKLNYEINKTIPQGAWCATIIKGSDVVEIEAGNAVFTTPNFFVFGVWDGVLTQGGFDKAVFACCTGASLKNCPATEGICFSTPSHLLEALYIIESDGLTMVSNSLPFLLKRSNSKLDPAYFDYQRDMCSSLFGKDRLIESSPLADGKRLQYFRNCNFTVDKDLRIFKEVRDSGLTFSDYNEYLHILRDVLYRIKQNAQDSARAKRYNMITTISRGYDAPATAALAAEIGCDKAFTFNAPAQYQEDCGTVIAQELGFTTIYERNADSYMNRQDLQETTALITGNPGPGLLTFFEKEFKDSLIFEGTRGDSVWGKNHDNVNDRLDFTSGNTFQQVSHTEVEFSLENNSIFIHLPLIVADKWSLIDRISSSPEMEKWSIGNNYDRPIPRRILEDKNIGRNLFGQQKLGMGKSIHFDTYKRVKSKFSPNAALSLDAYKKSFKQPFLKKLKHYLSFYSSEFPTYFNYIATRSHLPFRLKQGKKFKSSPLSTLLISWSVAEQMKKY